MIVIFCVPGKEFSSRFLTCWTDLIVDTRERGIEGYLKNKYTSNVYLLRNLILRQDNATKGSAKELKPFPNIAYDYLMWIDSDMVFTPQDFRSLLLHDKDIITGLAVTDPMTSRLNCGVLDEESKCQFWYKKDLPTMPKDKDGLVECDFAGFGWLLVKRGVFESMDFPWFKPTVLTKGKMAYFPSEDITWSIRARELGYKIYADTNVRVGHEKPVILRVPADGESGSISSITA